MQQPLVLHSQETLHQAGIEVASGVLLQPLQDIAERPGRPVGTVVAQGIEGVHQPDDAGRHRDRLTRFAGRIPAPIPVLMVKPGDFFCDAHDRRAPPREDLRPDGRVPLHDGKLLRGKPPGLEQDRIGDSNLAEIVERSSPLHQLHHHRTETQRVRQQRGHPADPLDVLAGIVIPELGGAGQPIEDLEPGLVQVAGPLPDPGLEDPIVILQMEVQEAGNQEVVDPEQDSNGLVTKSLAPSDRASCLIWADPSPVSMRMGK